MRRRRLVDMKVLAGLLILALMAPASALGMTSVQGPAGAAGAHAAKKKRKRKPKPVRCKRTQVRVTVNGRRTCRSLRAALPRPRAVDRRLSGAGFALGLDLGRIRDRRHRRGPSLQKLLRRVGRSTYRNALRAIPQGLARIDRLGGRPVGSAARRPVAAAARAACGAAPIQRTESFTGPGYDAKVDLGSGNAQFGADVGKGGSRVEVDLNICDALQDSMQAPACPSASGAIDATDHSRMRAAIRVFQHGELVYSNSVDTNQQTTMHGQVGDDAKLDHFDLRSNYTLDAVVGGSKQAFGQIGIHLAYQNSTRVNMRGTPSYDPGNSDVNVKITVDGVDGLERSTAENDIARQSQKQADDHFAAVVKKAIEAYRAREAGWNEANTCVDVKFNPASHTLKLRKGQTGQFAGQTIAKADGGSPGGHWSLTGQANGTFSPASAEGGTPQFNYSVTNAGKDIVVKGTLRVTSRAGIAQADWAQETEDKPVYVGDIHYTTSVDTSGGQCSEHDQHSYSATLADSGGPGQPFDILESFPRTYGESVSGSYDLECNPPPGCSSQLSDDPDTTAFVSFSVQDGTVFVSLDEPPLKQTADPHCSVHTFTLSGSFPQSMIGEETIPIDFSYQDSQVTISGGITLHRVD